STRLHDNFLAAGVHRLHVLLSPLQLRVVVIREEPAHINEVSLRDAILDGRCAAWILIDCLNDGGFEISEQIFSDAILRHKLLDLAFETVLGLALVRSQLTGCTRRLAVQASLKLFDLFYERL